MFNSKFWSLLVSLNFLWFGETLAQQNFRVPALTAPVMDQAGMLSSGTIQNLDAALRRFNQAGGAQIAVLTVNNLSGLTIEEASIHVVDIWKLGDKKLDNGLLLLIARAERSVRIEVGQGLEGDIPDAIAKRIISEIIEPSFKAGDFNGGVINAILAITKRTNPNLDLSQYLNQVPRHQPQDHAYERKPISKGQLIFWGIILLLLLFTRPGRLILFSMLLTGGRGRGGFGGGGGGGGGFGGGGGGFSGGGASGRW